MRLAQLKLIIPDIIFSEATEMRGKSVVYSFYIFTNLHVDSDVIFSDTVFSSNTTFSKILS